jgi:hypothetical protein
MWMRSSQVVRASGCNSEIATVLGSIPASSDTVESEGRQMKQCLHLRKNRKIPPLKKIGSILFWFNFFASFSLFPFVFLQIFSWSSNFSVYFRFTSFFRFISLISRSFSLQSFAVSLRCETSKIIFASISIFASEAKTRAHPSWMCYRYYVIQRLLCNVSL